MSMMMLFAALGAKTLTTVTLSTSQTYIMPVGVNFLNSVVGRGAAGTPASSSGGDYYNIQYTTLFYRRDGTTEEGSSTTDTTRRTGSHPANGAGPTTSTPDSTIYYGYATYTEYFDYNDFSSSPATTGASTTGFGQTFVGGTGGAATPVTVNNVAVTSAGSYVLVIPSGGAIQITFYQ